MDAGIIFTGVDEMADWSQWIVTTQADEVSLAKRAIGEFRGEVRRLKKHTIFGNGLHLQRPQRVPLFDPLVQRCMPHFLAIHPLQSDLTPHSTIQFLHPFPLLF